MNENNAIINKIILLLEPGRLMDDLIAEKIMGYKPVPVNHWLPEGALGRGSTPSNWLYIHPKYGDQVIPMHCFHPSQNIEKAWEIVNKLTEDGYNFSVQYDARIFEGTYTAKFKHLFNNNEYAAAAKKPEEAICKAALLASNDE